MWSNPQETADLVTFTEEILNGKLHFLRSDIVISVTRICIQGPILLNIFFCSSFNGDIKGT